MENENLIKKALEEAKKNEAVVGALIVRNGEILSEGTDSVLGSKDPTAHAEVVAIRKAAELIGTHRLYGCVLVTSCEPCLMCYYAAYRAKIKKIIYGATIQDIMEAGYKQTKVNVIEINEKEGNPIEIIGPTLREECRNYILSNPKDNNIKP